MAFHIFSEFIEPEFYPKIFGIFNFTEFHPVRIFADESSKRFFGESDVENEVSGDLDGKIGIFGES